MNQLLRLQKIISESGLCSRRAAERLIADGRVSVNGKLITEAGVKADPNKDIIKVDNKVISQSQDFAYYIFNKPAGYLSTLSDPAGRPTIKQFLNKLPVRVFPVGRLDMDVEGLLILTNDGELARRLMHPSYEVPKIYRVKVAGHPDKNALEKLRNGVLIIGDKKAAPAEASLIKSTSDRSWINLTLTEGRRRQVKRMCSAIGHPVLKLKRERYANLGLKGLEIGDIRPLTPVEIKGLKKYIFLN